MSKNYNNLWVLGDSFTTPDVCVSPQDSFWGLVARHCNIDTIKNCSRPVNSFDGVCQLLVGMQKDYNWQTDLFLIGIPPLERVTVFDNFKDIGYQGHEIDTSNWSSTPFKINAHHGLITLQNHGDDKLMIAHSDRAWTETQAMRTVFLLTSWLDRMNANYAIVNLSNQFDKNNIWGPSEFLLPYCLNHPRCILFEDTYRDINIGINKPPDYDKYGWGGHHGADGNMLFFTKSLWPRLQTCNLV